MQAARSALRQIKTALLAAVPGQWLGALDYYRGSPSWVSWSAILNGQARRVELFQYIMRELRPVAIVETGTFGGTTAEFFAATGLPIYTIEKNPRYYGFSRRKLRRYGNVTMLNRDSRVGLRTLLDGPLRNFRSEPVFFYLDAHWEEDLPLIEEVKIVLDSVARPIIMVDDFEVPGDPGYEFDDYGNSGVLTESYLKTALSGRDAVILYPSAPSIEESGARRGCCIICRSEDKRVLTESQLARSHPSL